jgi:hypothetical protein
MTSYPAAWAIPSARWTDGRAADRDDLRRTRQGADLPPETGDVCVEGVVVDDGSVRPGGLDESFSADGFARRRRQLGEKPELGGSQHDRHVAAGDCVLGRIEDQPTRFDIAFRPAPPYQRFRPRQQLREGERLGEVVVATDVEPREPVGQRVAGSQEKYGSGYSPRTKGLAHVASVGIGQADVDQEQIRDGISHVPQQVGARGVALRSVALFAQAPEQQ